MIANEIGTIDVSFTDVTPNGPPGGQGSATILMNLGGNFPPTDEEILDVAERLRGSDFVARCCQATGNNVALTGMTSNERRYIPVES